jgi:DNA-binding IclR family transcriptional regulator
MTDNYPGPKTKRTVSAKATNASKTDDQLAGTQSIRRAVSILKEISIYGQRGVRLVDIANTMQLERPTVHRIIRGLVSQGMVVQNPTSKLYRLGPVVYELGIAASPYNNLREICQPALRRLADRSGDSVYLVVRSGMDTVCFDRLEGSYPIKTQTLEIGARRPLGSGAGSLAIMLELPQNEIDRVIEVNASRYSLFGLLTADRLRDSIEKSREAGYAINEEDVLPGVVAIGAPLRNADGTCYAGISIAGIAPRLAEPRRGELASILQKEARQLSRKLVEAADK